MKERRNTHGPKNRRAVSSNRPKDRLPADTYAWDTLWEPERAPAPQLEKQNDNVSAQAATLRTNDSAPYPNYAETLRGNTVLLRSTNGRSVCLGLYGESQSKSYWHLSWFTQKSVHSERAHRTRCFLFVKKYGGIAFCPRLEERFRKE